ncbi:unnamed protein product [Thelazia callipaeda]|uniref:Senescence domain-containing protein n=1 Tax=Thelazia callipaeda TaxID=103827 RepID=A0A0N5D4E4_THECL|nr:unnamed protein product [Thelazia callipaeda]
MAIAMTSTVDELYSEAWACIEQGLCYDEVDDTQNALAFYERSLLLMKEASKEKNCKESRMYETVMKVKEKVESRIKELNESEKNQTQEPNVEEAEVEAKEVIFFLSLKCYKQMKCAFQIKKELKKQIEPLHMVEADLIYFIPDGVQLFIIEVGPWSYPLVRGETPVLKNDFGAYVVPNPVPEHPDMFVGILLPKTLDQKEEDNFFSILKQHTELRTLELSRQMSQEEREHLSQKIGDFLVRGGDYLASNINHVAQATSRIVVDGSSQIRSSLKRDEKPLRINPAVRFGIHYVHKGSKVVAKCTRYLLNKIGDMGVSVGKTLASGAEKHLGNSKDGIVHGTIYVLGSGITSVSTVWIALENASKVMAKNIADETVDVVKHKWGDQASVTAHEVLYATGHSSLAALQLWDLGPRTLADLKKCSPNDEVSANKHSVDILFFYQDQKIDSKNSGWKIFPNSKLATNLFLSDSSVNCFTQCTVYSQPTDEFSKKIKVGQIIILDKIHVQRKPGRPPSLCGNNAFPFLIQIVFQIAVLKDYINNVQGSLSSERMLSVSNVDNIAVCRLNQLMRYKYHNIVVQVNTKEFYKATFQDLYVKKLQAISVFVGDMGNVILRCWDATTPPSCAFFCKNENISEVIQIDQELDKLAKEYRCDIIFYSEHGEYLKNNVMPGDVLLLVNVHYYVSPNDSMLVVHEGGKRYNRGSIILDNLSPAKTMLLKYEFSVQVLAIKSFIYFPY